MPRQPPWSILRNYSNTKRHNWEILRHRLCYFNSSKQTDLMPVKCGGHLLQWNDRYQSCKMEVCRMYKATLLSAKRKKTVREIVEPMWDTSHYLPTRQTEHASTGKIKVRMCINKWMPIIPKHHTSATVQ